MPDILLINPSRRQYRRARLRLAGARLIVLADYHLGFLDEDDEAEFIITQSLLPPHHDQRIHEHLQELLEGFQCSEPVRELLTFMGVDLLRTTRLHMASKILYPFVRRVLICQEIKRRFPAVDRVYADLDYGQAMRFWSVRVIRPALSLRGTYERIWRWMLPPLSLGYEILLLPVLARLVYGRRSRVPNGRQLLLGNINEFVQFNASLEKAIFPSGTSFFLVHPMRRYRWFRHIKSIYPRQYDFCSMDAYFSFTDAVAVTTKYLHILKNLQRRLRREASLRLFDRQLMPFVIDNMLVFYTYFLLVAVKHACAGRRLVGELEQGTTVVFSYAHTSQMNTLNHVFRAGGFRTITYNHGLIQLPYEIPSETCVNYSDSVFDLEVMRRFSSDEHFEHIQMKHAFPSIRTDFQRNMRLLLLTKLMYTDAPYTLTLNFLKDVFFGIRSLDLARQEVAIKPHPKEPGKRLTQALKRLDTPKLILEHGNLAGVLRRYNFTLSPMSTTVLECLRQGVPFLVVRNPYDSNDTFISALPRSLVVESQEDFATKFNTLFAMSQQELNTLYGQVTDTYYGGVHN